MVFFKEIVIYIKTVIFDFVNVFTRGRKNFYLLVPNNEMKFIDWNKILKCFVTLSLIPYPRRFQNFSIKLKLGQLFNDTQLLTISNCLTYSVQEFVKIKPWLSLMFSNKVIHPVDRKWMATFNKFYGKMWIWGFWTFSIS